MRTKTIVQGLLLASTAAAHLAIQLYGQEQPALVLVLDHVFDLALTAAIAYLAIGVGHAVLARCGYAFTQPVDHLLFALAVGSGTLATAIVLCGMTVGLRLPILAVLLIMMATFARKGLREVPPLVRKSMSFLAGQVHPAAGAIFFIMVMVLLAQALLPVTDWDSLMYHVRVPAQFLQQGRIYIPEDNQHSVLVQLVHMLYLLPLALKSAAGPALLSVTYAVGLGLAIYSCALRFFNPSVATGSLVMLWGSTAVLLVAVTPRTDTTIGFLVFLAHYALLEALASTSSRMFFLAAVLLGFAVGVKLNALVYALALSPLILWAAWRSRTLGATVQRFVLFGLLVLGVAAPWFLKTWLLFGSPLYPYFSTIKLERWLTVLAAGQISMAETDQAIHRFAQSIHVPISLTTLFWGQGVGAVEWGGPYYLSLLIALLPLWALFRRHKQVVWLIVPGLMFGIVVLATAPAPNVRYLVPAMPALTIAATYLLYSLCSRVFAAGTAGIVFAALVGVALLPASIPLREWATNPTAVRYLSGVATLEEYLLTQPLGGVTPQVSRELPRESRVLMLFEARGYYFNVPVLQDNYLMNWWFLLKTDLPLRCLESSGITHVLINTGALDNYFRGGIDKEILGVDALNAFASRCLVPILEGPGYVLSQVRQ